jgi:hypothetical protein
MGKKLQNLCYELGIIYLAPVCGLEKALYLIKER